MVCDRRCRGGSWEEAGKRNQDGRGEVAGDGETWFDHGLDKARQAVFGGFII